MLYGLIRDFDTEIARCLVNIAAFAGDLGNIPRHYEGGREPFWENGWFGGIDAAALYAFLRMERPSAFVEIGGGNSTMFARRAIRDQGSSTRLISIDPAPRADIDQLCDEHIRLPLEALDARGFPQLRGGDMVFLDGSHRLFTGSDAAVFFTDLLPRFPAGVLVGIDDIYLPYDYPPELHDRYYSEQYALAMYLLGGAPVDVVLPCTHVCVEPHLRRLALDVLAGPELSRVDPVGSSFWIRTR